MQRGLVGVVVPDILDVHRWMRVVCVTIVTVLGIAPTYMTEQLW